MPLVKNTDSASTLWASCIGQEIFQGRGLATDPFLLIYKMGNVWIGWMHTALPPSHFVKQRYCNIQRASCPATPLLKTSSNFLDLNELLFLFGTVKITAMSLLRVRVIVNHSSDTWEALSTDLALVHVRCSVNRLGLLFFFIQDG